MQYTNHYNLNLPEGSDIVNPLVQDNPNYSAIDTALYDNKVRTVGNATEVKSGTVHAITRSDSDIDVIRFTSTGNWVTGDTMTVDGTPVSVYLPDGTAPLTGAYVINSEVICALNGSRVTLYTGGVSSFDAVDVDYDNSVSGLTATNAQAAIDELSEAQNIKYDNTGSGLTATDVQAAIDEVNGNITPIKKVSFSTTTSSLGNGPVPLASVPATAMIVGVSADNKSYIVTPFLNGNATWYVHATELNGTPVANTAFTVNIAYID